MKLLTNLISMIHIFGRKDTPQIFIFLFIFSSIVSVSCSDQGSKDFNWVPKVAEITGKDLESWLRKTPYQNELKKDNENECGFSNGIINDIIIWSNNFSDKDYLGRCDFVPYFSISSLYSQLSAT